MNKYVVVGTYQNGNKKAFILMEDNPSNAIKALLTDVKEIFINIEVIDLYGGIEAVGIASFYSEGANFYQNASKVMLLIENTMARDKIEEAIDEYGEATDEFHERFDKFYNFLTPDGKDALLTLAGSAKRLVKIIELAGHDCL